VIAASIIVRAASREIDEGADEGAAGGVAEFCACATTGISAAAVAKISSLCVMSFLSVKEICSE